MAYTAQRVNFPFAQALALARQFQALADQVDRTQTTRQGAKHLASDQWQGKFSTEFDQRVTRAATGAGNVSGALRKTATDLARAWADAQHQQQLYLHYAMAQHKKDNQNIIQQGLSVFGLDSVDTGSKPGAPAPPGPPGFAPTPIPQAQVPGETPPPLGTTTGH